MTEELIKQNAPVGAASHHAAAAESGHEEEVAGSPSAKPVKHSWSSGDRCMATWSNDGQ